MFNLINWQQTLLTFFHTLTDILTAGIAITAFSLLIFAFTYRIWDHLTVSFTLILICVTLVYAASSFTIIPQSSRVLEIVLKTSWIGIILLPAAYFNFSDALLTSTGKPSRGRRRAINILTFVVSGLFILSLPSTWLVGRVIIDQPPTPYLQHSILSAPFTIYFLFIMVLSWYNLVRSLRRSVTPTSRRRMMYLVVGAIGPAVGLFPFLLYGSDFASHNILLFWLISAVTGLFVWVLMVVMSYAVAFYGLPWPDRMVKSRMFRWLLRGPIAASITLATTTLVRRLGDVIGLDFSSLVVLVMVGTIVIFEIFIILFAPLWEKIFFSGRDRKDLGVIRSLEDRLLTQNDLRQFLEMILATICDRVQAKGAFLTALDSKEFETIVFIGRTKINDEKFKQKLYQYLIQHPQLDKQIEWEGVFLVSLYKTDESGNKKVIGVIGINGLRKDLIEEEHQRALNRLAARAALALKDRRIQEQLIASLEILTPQVSAIQNLLAVGRYDQGKALIEDIPLDQKKIDQWVKDSLTHLWGGPKLSDSPLLQLYIIQKITSENEGKNPTFALREILRKSIQDIRPVGERQYTNEWILFNILEMKFIEGMKVRDIAHRLALSEADLYRKQRIAISAVATQLIKLEQEARQAI